MDVVRALRALPRVGFLASFLVSPLMLSSCGYNGGSTPEAKVEKPRSACAPSAIPNRFLVRWKDGSLSTEEAADRDALVRDVIEPNNDDIEFAEHDFVVRVPAKPSGPQLTATPAPNNPAPNNPPSGPTKTANTWGQARIDAPSAWAIARGQGSIVAVIDSGADVTHEQLKNQIAVNLLELNGKEGVDDDGNGYVDDIYGYDFMRGSGDIHDGKTGHGTHVSGVIAAEHQAADGTLKGVAPDAKILPLNFMDDSGSGSIGYAIEAIDYAVARGARVINASWGGEFCSIALQQKISELSSKGVVFVAAAGNGDEYTHIGFDLEERGSFPGGYDLPGIVTVGAMGESNRMTGFSNYSRKLVHILAPGAGIRSTYPLDNGVCVGETVPGYCTMDGTSMASPFVAGALAVLVSYRPSATVMQLKSALLTAVDPAGYAVSSGGRLNLRKALDELAKRVAP